MSHMNETKNKLVTGLGAAVALAAGSSSYAAVVKFALPANIAPNNSGTSTFAPFDVDGDGFTDIGFLYNSSSTGTTFVSGITAFPDTANPGADVVGYSVSGFFYASRLMAGNTVGPSSTFSGAGPANYYATLASNFNSTDYGTFKGNVRGFAGFSFPDANDKLVYGYIELQTSKATGINFFSGAYESTPNTAIVIPSTPTPEPTSLAGLAFGAAALLKRRRD